MPASMTFPAGLSGKTAVVTGAGGVMCSHFSRVLARAGVRVALLDIDGRAAEEAARAIRADGYEARAYRADVLVRESLEEVHRRVLDDLGPCDLLINGAGGNNPRGNTDDEFFSRAAEGVRDFYRLDLDGFKFVFDLNFIGTLLPTQVFSADMPGRPGCSILNVSSMNAYRPLTKLPAYSAAKAAVSNFTEWLATYFAKEGIRVNALAPGFFITNQNRPNLLDAEGGFTDRARKILAGTPMGRFGEIDELSGALLFLLSPQAASFITGVVLPVDGGFNAYCGV